MNNIQLEITETVDFRPKQLYQGDEYLGVTFTALKLPEFEHSENIKDGHGCWSLCGDEFRRAYSVRRIDRLSNVDILIPDKFRYCIFLGFADETSIQIPEDLSEKLDEGTWMIVSEDLVTKDNYFRMLVTTVGTNLTSINHRIEYTFRSKSSMDEQIFGDFPGCGCVFINSKLIYAYWVNSPYGCIHKCQEEEKKLYEHLSNFIKS